MDLVNLFHMRGLGIALVDKTFISFIFTQKAFFPLDFPSIWLFQGSTEKDS